MVCELYVIYACNWMLAKDRDELDKLGSRHESYDIIISTLIEELKQDRSQKKK
jgi:hypothetical protein